MYKVVVTKPAEGDLLNATLYIANKLNNPSYATVLINNFETAVRSLKTMPTRQPLVRDRCLAALKIRWIQIDSYIIFYRINEKSKTVSIVRFLYAKRNWQEILK